METQLHRGDANDVAQKIWANQADIARLHLIHDFGDHGARYLFQVCNPHALIANVLEQRAKMSLEGTLTQVGEDGTTTLSGKLDAKAFGLSDENMVYLMFDRLHGVHPVGDQTVAEKGWNELMAPIISSDPAHPRLDPSLPPSIPRDALEGQSPNPLSPMIAAHAREISAQVTADAARRKAIDPQAVKASQDTGTRAL